MDQEINLDGAEIIDEADLKRLTKTDGKHVEEDCDCDCGEED
jgi:hypothetical protein